MQREDIFDTTTLDSGDTSTEESSSEEKQQQQQLKQQQNSTSDVAPHLSDEEKLRRAKAHLRDDQILAAARLVRCLKDKEAVTTVADDDNSDNNSNEAFLEEVERKAALIEGVIADLNTDPGDKWIKMGESHNSKRDTIMYYQLTKDLQLKCRLETPIESSLLVPLLSVLNETDLFTTWMPSWNYPRLGLDKVEKLAQMGRTEQTIQVSTLVQY